MALKKLSWVTADYFLQVDMPLVPLLAKEYDLFWIIIMGPQIKYFSRDEIIKFCTEHSINYKIFNEPRASSPLLLIKQIQVINTILKSEPDIQFYNYYGLPYFYFLIKILSFKNDRYFVGIHNVTVPLGNPGQKYERLYQKFGLPFVKNILTYSKRQYRIAREFYPQKKIARIPLPLTNFGSLPKSINASDEKVNVLFFGNILEYKRVDILIRAAEALSQDLKDKINITIAGDCRCWKKYDELIQTKSLFQLIIKRIPNDEVSQLFISNHYLVLPYQDIAQSGPLRIALRFGLPVIATKLESFEEDIKDGYNGYFFETNNIQSLTATLEKIIVGHRDKYSILQRNQDEYVKKNLADHVLIDEYIKMFENL